MNGDFWLRLAVASLVIIGVWNAFGKGQILDALGERMERWPAWLSKPMGLCPPCMSSTYGTAVWFILGGDAYAWPLFVLALSGAMVLIAKNMLRND